MIINKQHKFRHIHVLSMLSLVIIGFSWYPSIILAYSEPNYSPPSYDTDQIPEIINISGSATIFQQKKGSLLIGTNLVQKKFCLNPNLVDFPGTSDTGTVPPNCITSWNQLDISSSLYLQLFDGNSTKPAYLPSNIQTGYVGWQAKPPVGSTSQLFSFIASAPTGTLGATPATAIRADGVGTNYAAEFLGTVAVVGYSNPPQLCLNEFQVGGSCITSWSTFINSQIVSLQNLRSTTVIPDQGQTSASGALVVGAVVAGQPIETNPLAVSCGDNVCRPPIETNLNCSYDCI